MEGTRGCIHAKRNHHHLLLFYLYSPCKKKRPHLFKKVTLLRIFAYKMEGGSLAIYCWAGLGKTGLKLDLGCRLGCLPLDLAASAVVLQLLNGLLLIRSCYRSCQIYAHSCEIC